LLLVWFVRKRFCRGKARRTSGYEKIRGRKRAGLVGTSAASPFEPKFPAAGFWSHSQAIPHSTIFLSLRPVLCSPVLNDALRARSPGRAQAWPLAVAMRAALTCQLEVTKYHDHKLSGQPKCSAIICLNSSRPRPVQPNHLLIGLPESVVPCAGVLSRHEKVCNSV
jgi:hypothetical protein